MRIEVVTIGNEILSGRTLDTNFAHLARALEAVSVQIGWHTVVGDAEPAIGAALLHALGRADAVVLMGGLGPTPDDVTRPAVAAALDRPLALEPSVLEQIRERLRRAGRQLPASFESQALVPRGAEVWRNPQGSAPGLLLIHDGRPVILLPGVPHELEALAAERLVPYLAERSGRVVETFTLRTWGAYESALHEAIGPLPEGWPGGSLAYLPGHGGVDLRVTVAGDQRRAVAETAARARRELAARVGRVVYAEGTRGMEEVVGALLLERGRRIAVAESCTGGLLAQRLTDTPGSSRWFERGFVTYSNESKVELLGVSPGDLAAHGAVSAAVAEQMAAGAARSARVEVGVGVTGIAGPDGGSEEKPVGTVFVAVADPEGTASRRLRLLGSRALIRQRSAQAALDLVRRRLAGLPLEARLA